MRSVGGERELREIMDKHGDGGDRDNQDEKRGWGMRAR
jgi:hypothetical protein